MMAGGSEVVKKVLRLKLQLTDTAESHTVVKILQKLKSLNITLDILAETGIGKTVNSLRRHEQAGELAKSLVRDWKRLLPKESTGQIEDSGEPESLQAKVKLDEDKCPNNESLIVEDLNNNVFTLSNKCQDSSDEENLKKSSRRDASEKQREGKKKHKDRDEHQEKGKKEDLEKKIEFQEDEVHHSEVSKMNKVNRGDRKSRGDDNVTINRSSEDTHHKSRLYSKEKMKRCSENQRSESDKRSHKKLKRSDLSPKERRDYSSCDSDDKNSKTEHQTSAKYLNYSDLNEDSEDQTKRKKRRIYSELNEDSEDQPKRKKRKIYSELNEDSEDQTRRKKRKTKDKHRSKESDDSEKRNEKAREKLKDIDGELEEEPSMSFESYLNYDANVSKRKEKPAVKKPPKKLKPVVKECTKELDTTSVEMDDDCETPQQQEESLRDLINIPLASVPPECERPSYVEHFEGKVEKEPDFFDEESLVFTGQRLNKKMQVYSGNKTLFLPAMMSLHQQCIRTLQNNINLLYETGGVPYEILEPVLERCTPEQLLRIEECNPIYVGATDDLWGKHCHRDFKDSKLLEYESWKEMYIRLSEEREKKLKRLTKSIVSAHSNKPKGRQVKMAFIHTVAKPPRDVRIQQEIHGTAVQQPQQLRCRMSFDEPSRSSCTSSGTGNAQDPRKKSRIAPMMAKSLKAFRKQFGRR